MKKITTILLSCFLVCLGLSLTACSSPDYSNQIESLETRIAELESQNDTLNEINEKLEDTNKKLNEINNNLPTKTEYKSIQLSTDNYSEYIAFYPTIIDMYVEQNENTSYAVYLLGQLTTSSLGDYHFVNCVIDCKIEIYSDENGWETDSHPFAKLNYNGESVSSFALRNKSIYTVKVLNVSYVRVKVGLITGSVLVPKE